jgi:hypothetical protein
MYSREVAACYRLNAALCVQMAHNSSEPGRKRFLLNMAQTWERLLEKIEESGNLRGGSATIGQGRTGPFLQ